MDPASLTEEAVDDQLFAIAAMLREVRDLYDGDVEHKRAILTNIIDEGLAKSDDLFGTEGWRHRAGLAD